MRVGVVVAAAWIAVAACHRADPPRAPEPAATPAGPATIATTPIAPPTLPPGEAELQAALARDVRDASAYEGLARLYYDRSLSQSTYAILARQVIAQGLAVLQREGRTSADLLATRGLLELREGRVDRAIDDLSAAAAIDAGNVRAQAALGAAALRLRDYPRAAAALRAVVEAPGGDHDVVPWLQLGVALQELGRFDEAGRVLRRAAAIAPVDPRPHYALAVFESRKALILNIDRDEDATYEAFRRAHTLAGDDPRFADLRARAQEGMDGRRFMVCHYPVATFYGTQAEYEVWLRLLALERPRDPKAEEAERRRLLELERDALVNPASEE